MVKETIISVQTGKAVENIAQLRENIKKYKGDLEAAALGSDEYKKALQDLQANQQMLRDARHHRILRGPQ